jgi:hypothetical protein
VAEFGLKFLLAVSLRQEMDSAELLETWFPEIRRIVAQTGDYRKSLGLKVLVLLRPNVPPPILKFLSDCLKNNTNSDEDSRQIVAALVQSRDPVFIHQVIDFLALRRDPILTGTAIQVFGLTHTDNAEALSYIEFGLDSPDIGVKSQAIAAVARLPRTARTRFLFKLNRIAVDRAETESIRNLALETLRN